MIEEVMEFEKTYGYLDKQSNTYYYNAKGALIELGYKKEEEPDRDGANTILKKVGLEELTDEQFGGFISEVYIYALAIYGTNEKSDNFRKLVISTLLPHMRKTVGWLETLPKTLKDKDEKLEGCTKILNAIGNAVVEWQKIFYNVDNNTDVFSTSNNTDPNAPIMGKIDQV